jgi:hypothetical protein
VIDGRRRAAFDRKHRKQLLQFMVVEPQAVATGAFIEGQMWRSRMFDLNLLERGVATRTEMRTAFGDNACIPLKTEQGIARACSRLFHEGIQFDRVEPQTATVVAEIKFDVFEMQDEQRHVAFGANSLHIMQYLGRKMMTRAGLMRQALPV